MRKSFFLIALITPLLLAVYLLPTFIYNQLEYDFREQFAMAMMMEEVVDELIAVRQIGPNDQMSEEEFGKIASNIEGGLEDSIEYTKQATLIQDKQEKIPFLPTKYKEYHQLKQHLITDHNQLTKSFLQIKINEHLLTDTVQRLFDTQAFFRNYDFENQDLYESIEYLDYNTLRVELQAKRLYEANSISSEVYDYLIKQNEPSIHILEQFRVVIENQSWDKFDSSKIISPPVIDQSKVSDLFSDSYNQKRKSALDNHKKNTSAHYDEMEKVGSFYLDNHLGYDPLSTMLSKINDKYPLNKEYESSSSPSIVPMDGVNPDLISAIKHKIELL